MDAARHRCRIARRLKSAPSARRGQKKSRHIAGNESILEYKETRYRGDIVRGQGGLVAVRAAFVGKMRWPCQARFANEPAEAGPLCCLR